MLLLLCPSPVMDFLVDHGVLWTADLTQRLGFGKIPLRIERCDTRAALVSPGILQEVG